MHKHKPVINSCALVIISIVITCFSLSCGTVIAPSGTAVLLKGPYLLYPNDNTSMSVLWQADSTPQSSTIQWGTTGSYGSQAAATENSSAANMHQFSYAITGLNPCEKIYYKVVVDNDSSTGSFITAPTSSATSLSFYAYGDNRDGVAEQDVVLGRLVADMNVLPESRQTFCLHGGDITYDGEDEDQWDTYFFNRSYANTLELLKSMPVLAGLGNHDTYHADYSTPAYPGTLVRKYWPFTYYAAANRSYYSFDYGPAHFTILDQYADDGAYTLEASAQFQWVEQDLSSSNKDWKIVVFHEPAWTASTLEGYHGNNTAIQQKLCPIFLNNGVKVVVQGHAHYYSRCTPPDGIQYLTLGGGGAALGPPDTQADHLTVSAKAFNFARFDISGNVMTVEVIDDSGAQLDTFVVTQ